MTKTATKKVLGKGLSALIGPAGVGDAKKAVDAPSAPAREAAKVDEPVGRRVVELPLAKIVPNRFQARKSFDESSIAELANSIRENGILQPLAVRPLPGDAAKYELIAGERRFRAAAAAGLREVPVLVFDADDQDLSVLSLVENLQRENLNPIDEAEGLQALVDHFAFTQEIIADRVGKSRSAVANALRLLGLPELVKNALAAGEITAGHARALLPLGEADEILSAFSDVVGAGMSVRETERHVKRLLEAAKKLRARPRPSPQIGEKSDPNMEDLLRRLRERFATRLQMSGNEAKGRIEIHYFSKDERDHVLDLLARTLE
ncbi:MAG: ParB/RepB/Spo0J family partition protein [Deltaproteobacteria bacterium]|nr:ParB/RepB/Spo0J family partition protein [Deltaproteobacteria bacterium]